ncbi:unnamed protein product [Caretta caretta]
MLLFKLFGRRAYLRVRGLVRNAVVRPRWPIRPAVAGKRLLVRLRVGPAGRRWLPVGPGGARLRSAESGF